MQRRVPALILIASLITLGGASAVTAQDGPPAVGTPITYVDPDGIIRGDVTVREIHDPFTGYVPTSPPAPGTRDVMLIATFQAAIDQPFEAQPWQINLQDTDGVLYTYQYVQRPECISGAAPPCGSGDTSIPDLQGQTMAPDNRVSGVLAYVVPEGVTLDRVVYQPAVDRLIELADLSGGVAPAVGAPVTYTAADGSSATITTQLIDPFTGNDPSYPPTEGTRFVVLQPVFENTGQLPFYADPYDLAVRDVNGFIHQPGSVYQPQGAAIPPLEGQTMSPGDRVSGYIGFEVPVDTQLADLIYWPESGRIVTLADVQGGGAAPTTETPPASAAPPAASVAPVASPEPGASAGVSR